MPTPPSISLDPVTFPIHRLIWRSRYSAGPCPASVKNASEAFDLNCCDAGTCNNPPTSCAKGCNYDLCDGRHSWELAGNLTAAALRQGGYEYRQVFALDQKHCAMGESPNLWTAELVDTLVWVWKGYQPGG